MPTRRSRPAVPEPDRARLPAPEPAARGDGWRWQVNLEVLGRDLDALSGWPADRLEGLAPFEGPVIWVAGADSGYVRSEQDAEMRRLFPHTRKIVIKGAGHWVHAQRPEVVVEVLRQLAPRLPGVLLADEDLADEQHDRGGGGDGQQGSDDTEQRGADQGGDHGHGAGDVDGARHHPRVDQVVLDLLVDT